MNIETNLKLNFQFLFLLNVFIILYTLIYFYFIPNTYKMKLQRKVFIDLQKLHNVMIDDLFLACPL